MLLITSLLALSFVACSNADIQKDTSNASLENTYWKAMSFYDTDIKATNKEAYINFEKNASVNGSLGCNNFFGTFKIDEKNISFSKMGSTRMLCKDMKTEYYFSKVLHDTKKYEIKGKTLNFFNDKDKKISTFKAVYF